MVKDNEAYLAYLCIKALPQDERDGFIKDNADEWDRIQGEMSESMRQSRDTNLYVGDKAGTDRASVLAQLADEQNWQPDKVTILDSLLRMAIAMTEHKFAFERSREFKAVLKPDLAALVEKYRLWDPSQGRDTYKEDILKGTRWYEEGIFASLRSFWGGLVTLWNMDILFVDGKIGRRSISTMSRALWWGYYGRAPGGSCQARKSAESRRPERQQAHLAARSRLDVG
jgi:hypothetical protein